MIIKRNFLIYIQSVYRVIDVSKENKWGDWRDCRL